MSPVLARIYFLLIKKPVCLRDHIISNISLPKYLVVQIKGLQVLGQCSEHLSGVFETLPSYHHTITLEQ